MKTLRQNIEQMVSDLNDRIEMLERFNEEYRKSGYLEPVKLNDLKIGTLTLVRHRLKDALENSIKEPFLRFELNNCKNEKFCYTQEIGGRETPCKPQCDECKQWQDLAKCKPTENKNQKEN